MCSGERPIGAAKGKQTNTMASCQAPPPLRPFQCWRLTAKILLRCLRCQEDLCKILGPPSAGTIGGPSEEGGSLPTPPGPPCSFRSPPPLGLAGG